MANNDTTDAAPRMLRKDILRRAKTTGGTSDPDEIARFDALADEWWKPDGKFRVVHAFNAARVGLIIDALSAERAAGGPAQRPLDGLTLADIGCGVGIVAEPLARAGARITAVDASEQSILIAQRHAELSGLEIDYRCALPEDLLASGATFDVVTSLEVVEHVADPDAFLTALAGLVRPGGTLIVGTLNRTTKSWALAIVAAERVLGWLPRGTHDWSRFLKPEEIAVQLAPKGFHQTVLHGIAFIPWRWQWIPSRDASVNFLQVFQHDGSPAGHREIP